MATTRKRSSGFNSSPEEETQTLESLNETIIHLEDPTPEVTEEEIKSFVEETIVPTDDFGPRFIEEPVPLEPEPRKVPELKPAPKRHPRNIPKFSRTR